MAARNPGVQSTTLLDVPPSGARITLERWVADRGFPVYRARQIFRRLWQAPVAVYDPRDGSAEAYTILAQEVISRAER